MAIFRGFILLSLLMGLGWLGAMPPTTHAESIDVTTTDDELNTDGDCSLREAIQAANLNIAVDACPAGEDANTDTINAFDSYAITLAGANEDANATGDFDILDNSADPDLEIYLPTIDGNDLDRIFHIHTDASVVISATLSNGQADLGGAIYNTGTLYISGEIDSNQADSGGAVYNAGSLDISDGILDSNQAQKGGAIYNTGTITSNTLELTNNIATSQGGAIFSTGATASVTLDYSEIATNNAPEGGAIYNEAGDLTVTEFSVFNNTATLSGGAIFNAIGGNLILRNDVPCFCQNSAVNGGAIYNQGVATINQIGYWAGNTASSDGGALYNQGTVTTNRVIIWQNSAQRGAGIFNDQGSITLTNVTSLEQNIATQSGGGIYNLGGTVFLDFISMILLNSAVDGGGIYNTGTLTSDGAFIGGDGTGDAQAGNTASGNGGGVYNTGLIVANSFIVDDNSAGASGGGVYNAGSIDGVTIAYGNSAGTQGGGIYNLGTFNGLLGSYQNLAGTNGGGIYNASGTVNIPYGEFFENSAVGNGGAVYNANNTLNAVVITDSCIVDNSATAFFNATAQLQTATGNWWGAFDGPGPVAAGSGDTVSVNVDYSGFATTDSNTCGERNEPSATITPTPTNTATATPITPTDTVIPASDTPTDTAIPPTDTPTDTAISPTDTATNTAIAPTLTFTPSLTTCAIVATAPTLISPVHRTHTTDRTPKFRWSAVANAQSYRLMVYLEDRSFEYKKRVFVPNYTLTAGEALTPAKYLWRVRTQDITCSTWSLWSTRNTLFVD